MLICLPSAGGKWTTHIVVLLKEDGDLGICVHHKMCLDSSPSPNIASTFHVLSRMKYFPFGPKTCLLPYSDNLFKNHKSLLVCIVIIKPEAPFFRMP